MARKLLLRLPAKGLDSYLENVHATTTEQHGFCRESCTDTACEVLMTDVKRALAAQWPLYAVLIDFDAAFVLTLRNKVMSTLSKVDVLTNVLNLLAAILKENRTTIDDVVVELLS